MDSSPPPPAGDNAPPSPTPPTDNVGDGNDEPIGIDRGVDNEPPSSGEEDNNDDAAAMGAELNIMDMDMVAAQAFLNSFLQDDVPPGHVRDTGTRE